MVIYKKAAGDVDDMQMIDKLKKAGISFDPGMSRDELDRAESVFHFHFPNEIREFLFCGVPVGSSFFNFRDVTEKNIKRFFEFQNSIEKSFRFDLEYNREEMLGLLGEKLGFIQNIDAFDDAVMKYLSQSVRLIPFFAHRCFFDGMDNMPIVSFWRPTDTIVYGGTFENYLEVEFMEKQRILENIPQRMKNTGIWKDLIS